MTNDGVPRPNHSHPHAPPHPRFPGFEDKAVAHHRCPAGFGCGLRTMRKRQRAGRSPKCWRDGGAVDNDNRTPTQGSRCAVTLGFVAESLWDSRRLHAGLHEQLAASNPHPLPRAPTMKTGHENPCALMFCGLAWLESTSRHSLNDSSADAAEIAL